MYVYIFSLYYKIERSIFSCLSGDTWEFSHYFEISDFYLEIFFSTTPRKNSAQRSVEPGSGNTELHLVF